MIPYVSPDCKMQIGKYKVQKFNRLFVASDRRIPFDLVELEIPQSIQKISSGDELSIAYGYKEDTSWELFKGLVQNVYSSKTKEIFAKDMMLKLNEKISSSFVNVTPQEIISSCLSWIGISNVFLSKQQFDKKDFVIFDLDIISVLRRIKDTWDLDDGWSFYCNPDGSFFWGKWDESFRSKLPVLKLEYGRNIIDLKPGLNGGILKTVILPLFHSQKIKIVDQRYWQNEVLARVERVEIIQFESKGRMILEWTNIQI